MMERGLGGSETTQSDEPLSIPAIHNCSIRKDAPRTRWIAIIADWLGLLGREGKGDDGTRGGGLRVEVGDGCVVAFWQGDKFMACAFDDGEGDEGSRH